MVFGDDWSRNVSSIQHLFRQIAGDYPVVWINAIGHRVPELSGRDLRRIVQKAGSLFAGSGSGSRGHVEIGAGPRHVIQPLVLPWHHYAPVRALNAWSLLRAIRTGLARQGLTRRPVLVTASPPSVCVLGRLNELASAYFCMDDFLHLPGVSPHMMGPVERLFLERVDATVATARALVESKRPRSGRSYYLPQGVNFAHFAEPRAVPPELASLPRPIIGFAGGVMTPPMDLELVRRLAAGWPQGSVVLVGPVSADLSAVAAPNLHVLGPRPYRDLPGYVQAFDVGIIPYVLNEHTIAVDPLKLLEYLAAGVPVVTTDLPEVRKYQDAVTIAADHHAFVAGVRSVLEAPRDNRERRQAVALEHGWSRRAARLLEILAELVAANAGRGGGGLAAETASGQPG